MPVKGSLKIFGARLSLCLAEIHFALLFTMKKYQAG
jgi:hypothetical protein